MIKFAKCKCEIIKGEFNINDIPLDCPATWKLISSGHTVGVFQLEKNLGQDWAKRVRPDNMEELSALLSLLRPGPLECISSNTQILRRRYLQDGKWRYQYCRINKLYEEYCKWSRCNLKGKAQNGLCIMSINEENMDIFKNKITEVVSCGLKDVYDVRLRLRLNNDNYVRRKFYVIQATKDHLFLTLEGWKKLSNITSNDYIAIANKNSNNIPKRKNNTKTYGYKTFRDICLFNYKYECIFCDWDEGSLDTNHLTGNRHTNNSADNLCFMCPNHHRMYTDGTILEKEARKARKKSKLPNTSEIRWVRFVDSKWCCKTNTFDIKVNGPHHNYIAGNFVVHNSGMTQDYVDIKFGRKQNSYIHHSLKRILEPTYGCLVYQEQALRIATDVAGFSPEVADDLRKAIGKKKPELMAKLKHKFVVGCQKHSNISSEISEEIFSWIEKCQRYSFNKAHGMGYALGISYPTAWMKCHFPLEFFTSYLTYSQYKGDPKDEIYKLVQDARLFNVNILPPDIRRGNIHFKMIKEPDRCIAFGLAHIRGVGSSAIANIVSVAKETSGNGFLDTWGNFLSAVPSFHRNVGVALIKSGACDCFDMKRNEMVRELEVVLGTTVRDADGKKVEVKGLTNKEKVYFFDQLKDGIMTTREILLQMSQPPGDKTKTISQMAKGELVTAAVGYLDQADTAFDGIRDGDSKFVYTSPGEKVTWLEAVGKRTKIAIAELMRQNGYTDTIVKPPCSSDARRTRVASKAAMLEEPLEDTHRANAAAEKHFLGIALSCSEADDADDSLSTHTCLEIARAPNNESIAVCAIIDSVKHTKTKRVTNPGQSMCFLTISDSTYSIDHAVVFPEAFNRIKACCKYDLICMAYGEKKNGSFIIKDVQKLM